MAGNLRCWLPESTRQTRPPAKAIDLVVPLRNTQDLHCPDANLERYGIEPRDLAKKLQADPGIQAHALFIAAFADEAEQIRCALPTGRGHVCLDTSDLPRTFKQIFTSALGSN